MIETALFRILGQVLYISLFIHVFCFSFGIKIGNLSVDVVLCNSFEFVN